MTPRLHQINVTYVPVEDRMLLNLATSDDKEFRIWCTRRFTRMLMDDLGEAHRKDMFDESQEGGEPPRVMQRQVAAEGSTSQHQAPPPGTFEQSDDAEYPLGERGLLATTIRIEAKQGGQVNLHLGDSGGTGVGINMNETLSRQLIDLLNRASDAAHWFATATPAPAKKVVH